jgi:hypothetical protein
LQIHDIDEVRNERKRFVFIPHPTQHMKLKGILNFVSTVRTGRSDIEWGTPLLLSLFVAR